MKANGFLRDIWKALRRKGAPAVARAGGGLNARELCRVETRAGDPVEAWYVIGWSVLYPTMIAHIRATLAQGDAGEPGGALRPLWIAARALLPTGAWELVGWEKERCDERQQALRAQALEVCRLWFTELLHREHSGKPDPQPGERMLAMGLSLKPDDRRWRL